MLRKLDFAPGVSRESTQYAEAGKWYNAQNVRFRGGYPESIGGWVRDSDYELDGIVRDMFTWTDYSSAELFAIATDWRVYIIAGGMATNITPIRKQTTLLAKTNFTTKKNPDGSDGVPIEGDFIQIVDTGHGAVLNDFVHFSSMTGVAALWTTDVAETITTDIQGILEDNDKQVVYVFDANTYWVNAGETVATSELSGAAATAQLDYEENVGLSVAASGTGWGTGVYGGTGTPGVAWGEAAGIAIKTGDVRFSFLDNYNEDLIYSTNGGALYYWDTSEYSTNGVPNPGPLGQRLKKLGDFTGSHSPPDVCGSFMVSDRDGHVVALGCNDMGSTAQNNLLVRWSDQNNPFDWVPVTTNTAGGQMLRLGSTIVGAVSTKSETIVFTDAGIYSMRFVGPPDIFGFSLVSEGVELITERSAIDVANVVYFMGSDKFYAYTGSVQPMECPLVKDVFEDFNKEASSKVFCGLNYDFSEILWFYPSSGSWEPDKYVAFNYKDHTWYSGMYDMAAIGRLGTYATTYNRTAWLDSRTRSEGLASFISQYDTEVSPNIKKCGVMVQESGKSTPNGDMECILESSFFEIDDGGRLSLISRLLPDFEFFNPAPASGDLEVEVSLYSKDFPGDAVDTSGKGSSTQTIVYNQITGTYTPSGNATSVRARARSMAIKYRTTESTCASGWRLGSTRIEAQPDGRR